MNILSVCVGFFLRVFFYFVVNFVKMVDGGWWVWDSLCVCCFGMVRKFSYVVVVVNGWVLEVDCFGGIVGNWDSWIDIVFYLLLSLVGSKRWGIVYLIS